MLYSYEEWKKNIPFTILIYVKEKKTVSFPFPSILFFQLCICISWVTEIKTMFTRFVYKILIMMIYAVKIEYKKVEKIVCISFLNLHFYYRNFEIHLPFLAIFYFWRRMERLLRHSIKIIIVMECIIEIFFEEIFYCCCVFTSGAIKFFLFNIKI